jgi:transporter family protein
MTIAIIFGILASLLWAITNHIDKYLITNFESKSNIKVLLVFSTFIAGIIISPIWLILSKFHVNISNVSLICVLLASCIYIIATFFYYKAIEKNDTSMIVIMFQMLPVFSYLLALLFFKETLTIKQIIGSLIILISSIIISVDFKDKSNSQKYKALLFIILSCLCYATYYILFDVGIRNSSYYACAFWYQIGFLIIGSILLCIKSFQNPFIKIIKENGKKYFALNASNEAFNLIASLMVNFANVTIPLALANILSGFQGTFAFIIGVIGTIFFPKFIKEDLRKRVVIKKSLCIIIGIIGLIILVS